MRKLLKIFLIVITILSLIMTLSSCGLKDIEIYMFSDISECHAIAAEGIEDVQVTVYDSPKKDKYIKDLTYNDFYACKYSSAEMQFELFAYEFPNEETAKAYYENATGIDTSKTDTFVETTGLWTFERRVLSDNLAYTVSGPASDREAIVEFINQVFSKKIVEVNWSEDN